MKLISSRAQRGSLLARQSILLILAMSGSCPNLITLNAEAAPAKGRAAVTSAEVNGTFIHSFGRRGGGLCNTIEIQATGHNKLDVSFDLYYPQFNASGQLCPNMGGLSGQAVIVGDTAVYNNNEYGPCKITIKFVSPGLINVTQSESSDCGFGHNVTADGTYHKLEPTRKKNKR
jgi:hypothetical protein